MKRLSLSLLLIGCQGTVEQVESAVFAETVAGVWCDRLKECDRGYYDANYEKHADCLSDEEANWQETHDYYTVMLGCDYTAESGAFLYNEFLEMTCAELYEQTFQDDFDLVWLCGESSSN